MSANKADAEHRLRIAARALAIAIKPAYGDEDQLVRELLESADLVMNMGEAFKERSRYG